jgi:tRNA G18 (ribose-2'-O)-methylase SpoU
MITSPSNPKVKHIRALARKKERYAAEQFVIEGVRLIEEALAARARRAVARFAHRERRKRCAGARVARTIARGNA